MEQQGQQPANEIIDLLAGYIRELNATNKLAFLGLGLTTIYTVFQTVMPKFAALGFLAQHQIWVNIAATITTLFVYRVIDADLRKNVVVSLRALRSKDWSRVSGAVRSMAIFIFVVAAVRLLLSGGATLVSSIFIGDDLVDDGNTEVVEDLVKQRADNKTFVLQSYEKQVSEAQRTESRRVREAQQRGKQLVEEAVASGTPSQREMWRTNPGFFTSLSKRSQYYRTNAAYYERVKQAQAQAQQMEDEARTLISRLRNDKARELAQVAQDTTESTLIRLEEKKLEKAALKEFIITTSVGAIDLLLFIIAILTSNALALVMPYREDYEVFDDVPSLWPVIWHFLVSVYRIVVNSLGYGVHLVDNVAVAQLDKISDGSGVLTLLSKDVVFTKGSSSTKRSSQSHKSPKADDTASDTSTPDGDTGGSQEQQNAGDTGDTKQPQDDTTPQSGDTGGKFIEVPQITAEEITNMKKRVRRNWERSFENHKDAPKAGKTRTAYEAAEARAELRRKAEEEIETLQLLGYKVYPKPSTPMRLEIEAPPAVKKKYRV
ncbi:hypothetical protein KC887_00760 [Candidatus Kaiserbacteria bacterium]|nr:hypothetical protein [Candidatus Kaiserbacteria bacterium]